MALFRCKLKWRMDKGGHYDVEMKGWMEKVSIMMCKLKGGGWISKLGKLSCGKLGKGGCKRGGIIMCKWKRMDG